MSGQCAKVIPYRLSAKQCYAERGQAYKPYEKYDYVSQDIFRFHHGLDGEHHN
jgi:hypothetical protein